MRTNLDLSSIPLPLLIGMGLVLVLQIALAVLALVSLVRRPTDAVATGNKWIWVAIVVLFSFVGPILYFAVGRIRPPVVEQPLATRKRSSADIADALYGDAAKRERP
jgi:hypothetical protein